MTRVLYRTALASLLTANAAGLAALVSDGHGLAPLLAAVTSAYISLIVLGYALGAAWHVGGLAGCRWNHRRANRPTVAVKFARRVKPDRTQQAGKEQKHAEAMAAVAADAPLPKRVPAATVGYTAVMPIAVSGVSWGFGPHGAVVGEPQQQPWTAPVSVATNHPREARHAAPWAAGGDGDAALAFAFAGQHAGMPAELAKFDWEPAGGLR